MATMTQMTAEERIAAAQMRAGEAHDRVTSMPAIKRNPQVRAISHLTGQAEHALYEADDAEYAEAMADAAVFLAGRAELAVR